MIARCRGGRASARTKAAEAARQLGTVADVKRQGRGQVVTLGAIFAALTAFAFVELEAPMLMGTWFVVGTALMHLLGTWLVTVAVVAGKLELRGYGVTQSISTTDVEDVLFGNG